MERFRVRVAGNLPNLVMREAEERAMQAPTLEEHLNLSSRVYTLEKEMGFALNVITLGMVIGGYFLYRWYVEHIGSIPGVDHS